MSTRRNPLEPAQAQPSTNGGGYQALPPYQNLTGSQPGMFSPPSLTRGSDQSPSLSPPPRSLAHDSNGLSFSDKSGTELPPIQSHSDKFGPASNHSLPSLSSVTGGPPPPLPPIHPQQPEPIKHWPSLNPLTAFYAPSHVEPPKPVQPLATSRSPDRHYEQRAGSVSIDDPDVRAAAEALGELRADFLSSPPQRSTPLPGDRQDQTPEPLLSLITTSIPALTSTVERGTALVENATSLYNQGKNMSPRVVKNGVEYVEGYLAPAAKVVGNVSRKTGLEGSVRWLLNRRRHWRASDMDDRGGHKRRKTKLTDKEVEAIGGLSVMDVDKDRRMSISTVDTLPAYDDLKSPAYTETQEPAGQPSSRPGSSYGLQRIVVSTSSLGVSMTTQSREQLRYCLEHMRGMIVFISQRAEELKRIAEQYDAATATSEDGNQATAADRGQMMSQMQKLRQDIYDSLQNAILFISKSAGGSLPQNVRDFIIANLKSLPGKFPWKKRESQVQENGADQEKVAREGYNIVLEFTKEGLNTLITIADLLERTLLSAEEWINKVGYEKKNGGSPLSTAESAYSSTTTTAQFSAVGSPMSNLDLDVTMGEAR